MENLIAYGSAIKATESEDGAVIVSGYLVRFGAPDDTDLTGDYFSGETNFGPVADGGKIGVYYHHGLDGKMGKRQIGVGTVTRKDAGLWLEAQLEARDDYEAKVLDLIASGKAGYSSGAPPWLVESKALTVKGREVKHLTQWPIGEASITPVPAEYRNVVSIKSLSEPDTSALDALASAVENAAFEQQLDTLNSLLTSGRTA